MNRQYLSVFEDPEIKQSLGNVSFIKISSILPDCMEYMP
jgi:hypothetical protein